MSFLKHVPAKGKHKLATEAAKAFKAAKNAAKMAAGKPGKVKKQKKKSVRMFTFKDKSVSAPLARGTRSTVNRTEKPTIVNREEFLDAMTDPGAAGAFSVFQAINLNPGLTYKPAAIYPVSGVNETENAGFSNQLYQMATLYEKYEILDMEVEFKSQLPATTPGMWGVTFISDPAQKIPTSAADRLKFFENHTGTTSCNVWLNQKVKINKKLLIEVKRKRQALRVRSGTPYGFEDAANAVTSSFDIGTYDYGKMILWSYGVTASTTLGFIRVRTRLRLQDAKSGGVVVASSQGLNEAYHADLVFRANVLNNSGATVLAGDAGTTVPGWAPPVVTVDPTSNILLPYLYANIGSGFGDNAWTMPDGEYMAVVRLVDRSGSGTATNAVTFPSDMASNPFAPPQKGTGEGGTVLVANNTGGSGQVVERQLFLDTSTGQTAYQVAGDGFGAAVYDQPFADATGNWLGSNVWTQTYVFAAAGANNVFSLNFNPSSSSVAFHSVPSVNWLNGTSRDLTVGMDVLIVRLPAGLTREKKKPTLEEKMDKKFQELEAISKQLAWERLCAKDNVELQQKFPELKISGSLRDEKMPIYQRPIGPGVTALLNKAREPSPARKSTSTESLVMVPLARSVAEAMQKTGDPDKVKK